MFFMDLFIGKSFLLFGKKLIQLTLMLFVMLA